MAQYAREQGLSEQAAAMELADFFAGYGDYSKAAELGVDTSYMKALQQAELAAAKSGGSSGGGGSGGGGSSGGGDGGDGAADYDGLFAAALESGHAKSFIANNYKKYGFTSTSGLYEEYQDWEDERGDGGYKTLKYADLSDRGKQIADLIDSDGTTDYARAIDLIEGLSDRDEQNYLLRLLEGQL